MSRVYFILSQGEGFFSKLIKWYQYGDAFTHASVVIDKTDVINPYVVTAVQKVKAGKFWDIHTGIAKQKPLFKYYYIEVPDKVAEMYKDIALDLVGDKYDVTGVFGFLLRRDVHKSDRYFCSELVYQCLWSAGVELFDDTNAAEVYSSMLKKSVRVIEDKCLNDKVAYYAGCS
jgi:hypothetical protein